MNTPSAPPRRSGTRRVVRRGLLAVVLVLLACLLWAAWQLVQGGRALQHGAAELQQARAGLAQDEAVVPRLDEAAGHTRSARRHLADPLVRLAGRVPVLGRPVITARAVAASADQAVREALLPLARVAGADPAARLVHDGAIDLTYLSELAGPSAIAAEALRQAQFSLGQSPERSGVGQVDSARTQLQNGLIELQAVVERLALTTRVAPGLLGVDAPQRYLLIAQNPAEARGTGGLVGGYVLLEADNGIVRAVQTGSNRDLSAFAAGAPVVDLGDEFTEHYGGFGPTVAWVNSNVSPHFPYAATIWRELWERQTGEQLAGALTLDPVALSYLMTATGPVELSDGTSATADNVVDLTLRDTYLRFDDRDQTERKEYLQEISRGVAADLAGGSVDSAALVEALARGTREGRLKLWSADPAVAVELGRTQISGRLPEGRAAVGDVVVDVSGSKLDYYLDRTFSYSPACGDGPSTATLTLRNGAPTSGLPDYVTPARLREGLAPGTNEMLVTLYLPPQSRLLEATQDGQGVQLREGGELGLRWAERLVTLPAGESTTLRLSFDERLGASADVERVRQPLVREERFTVTECRR